MGEKNEVLLMALNIMLTEGHAKAKEFSHKPVIDKKEAPLVLDVKNSELSATLTYHATDGHLHLIKKG